MSGAICPLVRLLRRGSLDLPATFAVQPVGQGSERFEVIGQRFVHQTGRTVLERAGRERPDNQRGRQLPGCPAGSFAQSPRFRRIVVDEFVPGKVPAAHQVLVVTAVAARFPRPVTGTVLNRGPDARSHLCTVRHVNLAHEIVEVTEIRYDSRTVGRVGHRHGVVFVILQHRSAVGPFTRVVVDRPRKHVEASVRRPTGYRDRGIVGPANRQLGALAAVRRRTVNGHPKLAVFHFHPIPHFVVRPFVAIVVLVQPAHVQMFGE